MPALVCPHHKTVMFRSAEGSVGAEKGNGRGPKGGGGAHVCDYGDVTALRNEKGAAVDEASRVAMFGGADAAAETAPPAADGHEGRAKQVASPPVGGDSGGDREAVRRETRRLVKGMLPAPPKCVQVAKNYIHTYKYILLAGR